MLSTWISCWHEIPTIDIKKSTFFKKVPLTCSLIVFRVRIQIRITKARRHLVWNRWDVCPAMHDKPHFKHPSRAKRHTGYDGLPSRQQEDGRCACTRDSCKPMFVRKPVNWDHPREFDYLFSYISSSESWIPSAFLLLAFALDLQVRTSCADTSNSVQTRNCSSYICILIRSSGFSGPLH